MTDTTAKNAALGGGQKFILILLMAAILTMFAGSFAYRMKGSGLVVEVHQESGGMGGPMAGMMGVDMEQLRELMRRMEQNPNDAKALLELANAFMMMQAWDKAFEFATMAAKAAPQDPDVHRAMGMVQFERKEFAEARKSFDTVLKTAPDDALAHYNMGILLKHYLKKPAEGDAHFRRVVQLNPKDADVLKSAQEELAAGKGQ